MTIGMLLGLFGGLGMFIYGMHLMSEGLKIVAGNKMKHLLEVLTNNRFKAILVGIVGTIMVQSSSTTTVMVVGFVNASLMSLTQAAEIILGANIGTTVMAHLIAFNVDEGAPVFIVIGTFMALFGKRKSIRDLGSIVLGFGILFFGVNTMGTTMEPLKDSAVFIEWLTTYGRNPFLGLLIGTVITAIIQSSGATLGLLQALEISWVFAGVTGTGAIQICIPMMIGANIGTCVTALLSSIGTSTAAKNAAFINLFVNIFGAIWVMILLGIMDATMAVNPIYEFIVNISGNMTSESGAMVPNVARQIAMSHTFFNVANTIVLVPIINYFVHFLERVFPTGEEEKELQLDERLLNNPSVAIGQVGKEVTCLSDMACKNFKTAHDAVMNNDGKAIEKVYEREECIDEFEHSIIDYTIRLSNMNISQIENDRLAFYMKGAHDLERISDHAEDIAELAEMKIREKIDLSDDARGEIEEIMVYTSQTLDNVVKMLETEDPELCDQVLVEEDEIDKMTRNLKDAHMRRLNKGECKAYSGVLFLDLLANVKRVGDHAANVAQDILSMHSERNINKIEEVIF
ncbi:Na/Pi cotransporter family protein [Eubacterium aggregans]|uniref:Na/Pi cotransporter family protein n=1 Tax=Eubacterium aggregans TaxID=81409 RepID=UPI003F2EEC30